MTITLVGIIDEDFVNYRVPSMTLMLPYCDFKCENEYNGYNGYNCRFCQNSDLAQASKISVSTDSICKRYLENKISKAIVLQGLEPMDSFDEIYELICRLRIKYDCMDDIVIYTGYNKDEIQDKVQALSNVKNIIIKFGRFVPDQNSHYDEILGVKLASDNQYAERIS